MHDFLIVGAGLAGCVLAERIASVMNKRVLVIDKRDHIGGNVFDYENDNDILIHKYGPHAFHTNSKKVWDYTKRFTEWEVYFHKVLAVVEGQNIPIPFNFNSVERVFPVGLSEKIEKKLLAEYDYGSKVSILELKKHRNELLAFLSEYIYNNVFLHYTLKQWDITPEDISKEVMSRVPVLLSRDNRYFRDKFQGVPVKGYTQMVKNMLDHKDIDVKLETEFKKDHMDYENVIFTGPIDMFFDYKYGSLEYRSLEFDFRDYDKECFQESTQINYPNNFDFTRITEFKHFYPQRDYKENKTVVAFEYPKPYIHGKNDPYYPVINPKNQTILERYQKEAENLKNVHFIGRLAEYKYYNMDQIILRALEYFESEFEI